MAKHREMPEVAPFKADPTPEGLRKYLETMFLRNVPSSTTSSVSVDVWSNEQSASTSQRTQAAAVWEVDDQQERRVRRGQSVWQPDNRADTSAETAEEQYDDEEQEEESVRPPKRRAQSDPFRINEQITEHQDWEFTDDSSEERDLVLADEDPEPPRRFSFTRVIPTTVTVSPRNKTPETPKTPTKRTPNTTPSRPSKRGKAPLRGRRAAKNRHIYFD